MESLQKRWESKIPKYSVNHKELFKIYAVKGGAEGEKMVSTGKHFSTQYELYIYAFFLGLYENEFSPIPEGEKKVDFSHHIKNWGNKSHSLRKDFSGLQDYIFMALIAKTDIDLIELDKGELDPEDVVKNLISIMEAYTNGGLNLIQDKIDDNRHHFVHPTSFLDMIIGRDME